jgi:hypothetical protein
MMIEDLFSFIGLSKSDVAFEFWLTAGVAWIHWNIVVQSKCDDEQKQEGCAHTLETKLDVGKACSLCGLIKEDIKDLTFMWRRPVSSS